MIKYIVVLDLIFIGAFIGCSSHGTNTPSQPVTVIIQFPTATNTFTPIITNTPVNTATITDIATQTVTCTPTMAPVIGSANIYWYYTQKQVGQIYNFGFTTNNAQGVTSNTENYAVTVSAVPSGIPTPVANIYWVQNVVYGISTYSAYISDPNCDGVSIAIVGYCTTCGSGITINQNSGSCSTTLSGTF